MKSFITFIFLLLAFAASGQVLLSDANPPASDTTHGAAVILTQATIKTELPNGVTATNEYLRIEPIRAYMVRTADRLRLYRAGDHTEIPMRDLVHFKPDEN